MTALRDAYVEALIENVRQGAVDVELLDRIERLLSIEHGATAPDVLLDVPATPEPIPPHEEAQETGVPARAPLVVSAADEASPAPSPAPTKHSPLIGRVPVTERQAPMPTMTSEEEAAWARQLRHEDPEPESTDVISTPPPSADVLEREAIAPPAPASPDRKYGAKGWTEEARKAASERARKYWEERRNGHGPGIAIPPRDVDDPQNRVGSPPENGGTPSERLVNVKRGSVEELPPCTCEHQFAVSGPGHWHDEDCPRHACKYTLPPAAGLDGKAYEATCQGCGKPKHYDPGESMYNGHPVQAKHTAAVSG